MTPDKHIEVALQALLESAPDASVIVDSSGAIVIVNAQAEKLFGYDRDELVGKQLEMLVPDSLREHHSKLRTRYEADPQTRPMGPELDLHGRRKDGTEFPVEISLSPLEIEGEMLVASAIRDMTVHRRAENKFRGLLDSAPDGIVGIGIDGRIELVNAEAARMFGYRREELMGARLESLVPERLRLAHEVHREHYIKDPQTRPMGLGMEPYGRRKDGTEFPVEILLSSIRGDKGLMGIAAIRDVTDRKQAEAEAERLKSEFFALVSHELRTPLTSIIGYLDIVDEGGPEMVSPKAREHLAVIRRNVKRLDHLVQDLLLVTQVESGGFEIDIGEVDIGALADECLQEVRPMAEKAGVELRCDAGEVRPFAGDSARIAQTLENLVSNAIKFTPPGGTVTGRITHDGDDCVIEIADTGIGISPHDMEHLFDRFYRAEGAEHKQTKGAGLGLSIAKAIVESHGGTIEVDSTEGSGSVFTVRLPAKPLEGSLGAADAGRQESAPHA
jgi:PAS domain S-box-containing protein